MTDDSEDNAFEHARRAERVFVWILFGLAIIGFFGGVAFGWWVRG